MMEEMKSKSFLLLLGIMIAMGLTACSPLGLSLDKLPWVEPGQVLFKDDFSDSSTGWEKVNTPYELKGYSDGGYLISVKSASSRAWSVVDLPLQDVEIQVETKKISGPEDSNYGLICRLQDQDNYYSFVISSNGYFAIVRIQNGEEKLLGSEQFSLSDQIRPQDAINQITATCIGDQLSLSVNGQLLRSIREDSFSAGKVGLVVETRADGEAAVVFSNFSVIKR
jgi:hypothetical protein